MKSTIHFSCDHCGQSIKAPKEHQGVVLDCPTCQQKRLFALKPNQFQNDFNAQFPSFFKSAWKVVWKRAVVFLLLILLFGFISFPDHLRTLIFVDRFGYLSPDLLGTWILIILGLCLYFLPSFMAHQRKHLNREAIFVANLLLGWTVLGWVICLVWAVMRTQTKKQ